MLSVGLILFVIGLVAVRTNWFALSRRNKVVLVVHNSVISVQRGKHYFHRSSRIWTQRNLLTKTVKITFCLACLVNQLLLIFYVLGRGHDSKVNSWFVL